MSTDLVQSSPLLPTGADGSYLAPRQTIFADGALAAIGQVLKDLGLHSGNAAIFIDPVLDDFGVGRNALEALTRQGFQGVWRATSIGEPDLAHVQQVVELVREIDPVAVIAIGGGSTIDLSKIGALAATNSGDVLDRLGAAGDRFAPSVPVIAVPTTAGTGAESTKVAVVSVDGHKRVAAHPLLMPAAAILDPELLVSLPPAITAATGMDALAHAIEAFLSRNRTYFSAHASLTAIDLLVEHLPVAFHDGRDLASRRAMLYGAYMAGLALNAGVVLGHSIAYTIAGQTALPHGVTCAMALPYCISYCATGATESLKLIAQRALRDPTANVDRLLDLLERLNQRFAIPTSLHVLGIEEPIVHEMVQECIASYPRPNNPTPMDEGPLTTLFQHLHTGSLHDYSSRMLVPAGSGPQPPAS